MTTEELNTIVQAVIDKINGQVIDFDVAQSTPESTDLLSAVRSQNDGTYQGVTLKWDDVANAVTREAKGYRDDAQTAKTNVENMKASVEQTVSDFNTLAEEKKQEVQGVYQTDLNELKGDLDTEINARIEADTEHSTRLQNVEVASSVNRYEIENLKAKAEGKLYRTETVEAEAYALDVPSSVAPYAEVQKVGGKSVVWNQLIRGFSSTFWATTTVTDVLFGDNSVEFTSIAKYGHILQRGEYKFDTITGHKYFLSCEVTLTTGTDLVWLQLCNKSETATKKQIITANTTNKQILQDVYSETNGESVYVRVIDTRDSGWDKIKVANAQFIDLTLMFGSGNEPSLEGCKKIFSAEYYPYDAGTIKSFPVKNVKSLKADGTEIGNIDVSSFTTDFKSAGSAHDEWSDGKVTKRIGAVDLGTLNWQKDWYDESSKYRIYASISNKKKGLTNLICNGYVTSTKSDGSMEDNTIVGNNALNYIYIRNSSYKNSGVDALIESLNGMLCYYELKTPTEETIPEIDNFIEVEGRGTLTFESDETIHMPVPSTTRFVVDLT